MAKPIDLIVCTCCRRKFRSPRKRTFVGGFRKYRCPACKSWIKYPLENSVRSAYWCMIILGLLGTFAGGSVFTILLLGIGIVVLVGDGQIRRQTRRDAKISKPPVRPADADVFGPTIFVPKKPHTPLSSGQSEPVKRNKREEADNQNASIGPIGKQMFESSSSPVERRLDRPSTNNVTSHVEAGKSPVDRMLFGAVVAIGIIFGSFAVFFILDWSQTRPRPTEISAATASKPPAESSPKKVRSLASFTEEDRHKVAKIKALTVKLQRLNESEYWLIRGHNASSDPEAIYCYKRAFSIYPEIAAPLFDLGLIYEKNGQYQDAWNAYRRVILVHGKTSDIGRSASKRIMDLRIANKIQ